MLQGKLSGAQIRRLAKFGVVGFSGVFVNLIVSELLFRVVLGAVGDATTRLAISNAVGVVISIFTNFLLNDRWTWGDRRKGDGRAWFARLSKYYLSASVAGLLQVGVSSLAFDLLFQNLAFDVMGMKLDSTLSICTGIAAGMVINFLASHFWAFKDAEDA